MLKSLLSLPSDLDDMCDKAVFKHISKLSSIKKLLERCIIALTHAGKHLAFVLPRVYKYPESDMQLTNQIQTSSKNTENFIFVTK